ncbi:acetyl-CoA synthetase-like protein, partial [Schizophyllum commune Tattone D]
PFTGELYLAGPLTGELYLSGPTIAAGYFNNPDATGYYNNPDATGETFVIESPVRGEGGKEGGERWLRTGDRFYVDQEGWFFFSDRAKDTLKVSGAQVSPREIEEVSPREIEEVLGAWRGEGVYDGGAGLPDVSNALPDVGSRSGAPPGAGLPDASRTSTASPNSELVSNNNTSRVLDASSDLRVLDVAVAGVRGHGRTSDERVPRAWVVLGGVGE